MAEYRLPFQYQSEKKASTLTGFAGLPLFTELAFRSGFVQYIEETLQTKTRGWTDAEMILSLICLNLAGGDCISDIDRLEADAGLRELLLSFVTHGMKRRERRAYEKRWRKLKERGLPSYAAIHRYLLPFHSESEEEKRVVGEAFIPKPNEKLSALMALNAPLIQCAQHYVGSSTATLDQDATLTSTYKEKALYSYKGYKAYQPFNTYWWELGVLLHSEFRDGNVNAGFEQLRVLKEALGLLPANVSEVLLRSDSAGYQEELIRYCAEGQDARFGVIAFAIGARVTQGIKAAALSLEEKHWHPIYQTMDEDGNRIKTNQEWADICYVPDWVVDSEKEYRYIAIREEMKPLLSKGGGDEADLPFQTVECQGTRYKLFALVTNRKIDGNELIEWHRLRCGKSEQVHETQKEGLAGGQLPSNLFGANAAWWQIMVLSFNLNRLMQLFALPEAYKGSKMKALRLHVIQLPGRIIHHAGQVYIRVEAKCYELYELIRKKISGVPKGMILDAIDSS
jgi:Transposase DDE domain group 1